MVVVGMVVVVVVGMVVVVMVVVGMGGTQQSGGEVGEACIVRVRCRSIHYHAATVAGRVAEGGERYMGMRNWDEDAERESHRRCPGGPWWPQNHLPRPGSPPQLSPHPWHRRAGLHTPADSVVDYTHRARRSMQQRTAEYTEQSVVQSVMQYNILSISHKY